MNEAVSVASGIGTELRQRLPAGINRFRTPGLPSLRVALVSTFAFLLGSAAALTSWRLIAALGAIGIAFLLLFRPAVLFFAVILLTPLDIHLATGTLIDALMDPVRIIVGTAILAHAFARRRQFLDRVLVILLAFYLGVAGLSLLFNLGSLADDRAFGSVRALYKLVGYVVFAMAATGVIQGPKSLRRVYWLLVAGLLGTDVYALFQVAIQDLGPIVALQFPAGAPYIWFGRPGGLIGHPNTLGGYIDLILPATILTTLFGRTRGQRWISGVTAILSLGVLALTESRGAWIGAAVALTLLLILVAPARLRLAVSLGAISSGAALVFGVPFVLSRLTIYSPDQVETRVQLWGVAWDLFRTSPVIGVGYGVFQTRYLDFPVAFAFGRLPVQAHDLYLQNIAETGVLGSLAFLTCIGTAMARGVRTGLLGLETRGAELLYLGFAAGLLAAMVHGAVDELRANSPQYTSVLWLFVALSIGAAPWFSDVKPPAASRFIRLHRESP